MTLIRSQWELFDAVHSVYRTPTARQPYHAYLNGGHLYHFGVFWITCALTAGANSSGEQTFADGTHVYVRLPEGRPIGTNRITLPRFTFGLLLSVSHYQIRNLSNSLATMAMIVIRQPSS